MDDFPRAQQAAESYDFKLLAAGKTISSNYADLLALSARQILGSIDVTLALGSDGNWNFSDTLVFMKNIGAAGSDSPYVYFRLLKKLLLTELYAHESGQTQRSRRV